MKVESTPDTLTAFAKARALINLYGQDDPRAMMAMIDAVNLADPGFIDKTMRESGINLPSPEFVDDAVEPLWTSEQLADSVGVPHEQVMREIETMREVGLMTSADGIHRVQ